MRMTYKKLILIAGTLVGAGLVAIVYLSRGGGRASRGEAQPVVPTAGTGLSSPESRRRPRIASSTPALESAQLQAVLENAQLKAELSALKAKETKARQPSGRDIIRARDETLASLSPVERELYEEANHDVMLGHAREMRKWCPELLKENPDLSDDDLMARARDFVKAARSLPQNQGIRVDSWRVSANDSLFVRIAKIDRDPEARELQRALEKYLSKERAAEIAEAIRKAKL
jgi:hypothetical protein